MRLILFPLAVMMIGTIVNAASNFDATFSFKVGGIGVFTVTPAVDVILAAIIIITIATAVLSSAGTARMLGVLLGLMALWIILTQTGGSAITQIPIIGLPVYVILSIIYVAGAIELISGKEGA